MWCRWGKCKEFIFGKYLNIYGWNRKATGGRNPVPRRENREEWGVGPRFNSPRHGRVETQASLRSVRRRRIFDIDDSFDYAPRFARDDGASDFASAFAEAAADEWATPDKSQGKQGRLSSGCPQTDSDFWSVTKRRVFNALKDAGTMILCGLKKLVRFRLGESAKGVKGEKGWMLKLSYCAMRLQSSVVS